MTFTTIYGCRKLKGLSSKISACTPSFCTVYAVSKGKLSSLRPSDSETIGSSKDDNSDTCSVVSTSSNTSSSQTGNVNYLHNGLSCIFSLDDEYGVVWKQKNKCVFFFSVQILALLPQALTSIPHL